MPQATRRKMTSDEFIAWAIEQPEGERYELVDGEIYPMAPERSAHALAKFRIARRLAEAIEAARLPCTVYPDGMSVRTDDDTTYEPDAIVRCGEDLPDDAIIVSDPLIIVELLSRSTRAVDTGLKFEGYFRHASLRHYMIVDTKRSSIIVHSRDEAGAITTRIVRDGALRLDPPGIALAGLTA